MERKYYCYYREGEVVTLDAWSRKYDRDEACAFGRLNDNGLSVNVAPLPASDNWVQSARRKYGKFNQVVFKVNRFNDREEWFSHY